MIPPGGFLTHDKAEAAFVHLLKREGVDETWMWDQTMRKIIMDPLYKALDTLAQKKTVFEKVGYDSRSRGELSRRSIPLRSWRIVERTRRRGS